MEFQQQKIIFFFEGQYVYRSIVIYVSSVIVSKNLHYTRKIFNREIHLLKKKNFLYVLTVL